MLEEQLGGATAWLKRGHDLRLAELKAEGAAARLILQQASLGPAGGVARGGSSGVQGSGDQQSTLLGQQEDALEAELGRLSKQLWEASQDPARLVVLPIMGVTFVQLICEFYAPKEAVRRARRAEQLLPHTRVFLDAASESYRGMDLLGLEGRQGLRLMAEKGAAEIADARLKEEGG